MGSGDDGRRHVEAIADGDLSERSGAGGAGTRVAEPEVRVIKVIKKLETGHDEPTE